MVFIVCLLVLCIYRSKQRHIHGHCFFASAEPIKRNIGQWLLCLFLKFGFFCMILLWKCPATRSISSTVSSSRSRRRICSRSTVSSSQSLSALHGFPYLINFLNKRNHIQRQRNNSLLAHAYIAIRKFVSVRYIFVILHKPF